MGFVIYCRSEDGLHYLDSDNCWDMQRKNAKVFKTRGAAMVYALRHSLVSNADGQWRCKVRIMEL